MKANDLKNIARELYGVFDVKIILPKGKKGGEVDKFLSKIIGEMRSNGKYDKLMGMIDTSYDDWQI